MTRDALVSYAARDSRLAHVVCSGLMALGLQLWLDTEDLRWSRQTWRQAVQDGIAQSLAFLVLLSEHWDNSPACCYELAIALERRVPVVALSLADQPDATSRSSLLPAEAEVIEAGTVTNRIALVGERLAQRSA